MDRGISSTALLARSCISILVSHAATSHLCPFNLRASPAASHVVLQISVDHSGSDKHLQVSLGCQWLMHFVAGMCKNTIVFAVTKLPEGKRGICMINFSLPTDCLP